MLYLLFGKHLGGLSGLEFELDDKVTLTTDTDLIQLMSHAIRINQVEKNEPHGRGQQQKNNHIHCPGHIMSPACL